MHAAHAQTADELEILNSLPSDQRQSILDRVLGNSSTSRTPTTSGSTTSPTPEEISRLLRENAMNADTDNGIPVLKAEDTIIIEIDFDLPELAAPPPSAEGASAGGAAQNGASAAAGTVAPAAEATHTVAPARATPIKPEDLAAEERQRIERTIEQVRDKNPYRLSAEGVLYLPGFTGIALAGLTEEKAALRLRSEPALNKLELRVTRLPLKGSGVEALKPFGYELFSPDVRLFAGRQRCARAGQLHRGAGRQSGNRAVRQPGPHDDADRRTGTARSASPRSGPSWSADRHSTASSGRSSVASGAK